VGLRRPEVAGALARVARPHDDAAAAGGDEAGAGEHPRCRAAAARIRGDVAALPHEARTGAAGLRKDASGCREISPAL
jgi:hypothetical protein